MGSQERYSWDGQNCYDNGFADPIGETDCTEVADAKIFFNGSDVTGQTTNVIVGQQISLSIVITGSTTAPDHIQWGVPGTRIANYVANNSSGTLTTLDNLQIQTITFYWVDGGDNRQVQMSCKVNGVQFDKTTTFNVKRPTAQITVATNATTTVDSATGVLAMHLGDVPPSTPGLAFSRSITLPAGFNSGSTQWVQVFSKFNGGNNNVSFQRDGLDDVYPYDSHSSTSDSPLVTLPSSGLTSTFVDYTATMWLMFKPANVPGTSLWVPLREVTWSWTATATFAGGQWSLTSHTDPHNLSDADSLTYPTWTQNAEH
jgi:hypothetical protein